MRKELFISVLVTFLFGTTGFGADRGHGKLWALRPVGEPGGGDDVGPPLEIQAQRYRETGATLGHTGTNLNWALPEDPGDATPEYDFSWTFKNTFYFPEMENVAFIGLWCDWADRVKEENPERYHRIATDFVKAFVQYCNDHGVYYFHAGMNEPNLLRRTDWAELAVEPLRIIYPAMKSVNEKNRLLAGNLSAGVDDIIQRFYDAGAKDYFDVLDLHAYSNHPRTGVSIEQVIATYRVMVRNGDAHKKIFLGEGWGPGRSVPGIDRHGPEIPPSKAEIEAMRDFVYNGYRNMMNPKPGYHPGILLGASFFTLNDNFGGGAWAGRAIPIMDREGNITAYNLDGYTIATWEELQPRFYNGGIITFDGEPKGSLVENFPPELPKLEFRGWLIGPNGETQEEVPEWDREPQPVVAGETRIVEMVLVNRDSEPITIRDIRLALKGKDQASLQIAPAVQDLVLSAEDHGLRLRELDPVPARTIQPGEQVSRRFEVVFPHRGESGLTTLLGEMNYAWRGENFYYWDCWIPVEVLPKTQIGFVQERMILHRNHRWDSLRAWIRNNSNESRTWNLKAESNETLRVFPRREMVSLLPGETRFVDVLAAIRMRPIPGHYPVRLMVDDEYAVAWGDIALEVRRATEEIGVDADLSEWEEVSWVMLAPPAEDDRDKTPGPDWEGPKDLSGKLAFQWDARALYVAFIITDDIFSQEHEGLDVWRGDSVQLAFDMGLDAGPTANGYDQNDYEYTMALASSGPVVARYHGPLGKPIGLSDQIRLAVRVEEGAIYYEMAFPWEELSPFTPEPGAFFSASALANDSDGFGRKYIEWAGGVAARKEPGRFVPLRLME